MIAALGTLAFLATLWLLVVVGAAVLEESGAKIAAALKGKTRCRAGRRWCPVRLQAGADGSAAAYARAAAPARRRLTRA